MYPRLRINLLKYQRNIEFILQQQSFDHVTVMAVSKVFCADQELIKVIDQSDVAYIADSKIANLEKIQTSKPKVLLRIPQLSEVDRVIQYADISLNSEINTMMKLNEAAKKMNKKHGIILMFDIGDLREGIYYHDDYLPIVEHILNLEYIELKGIGANITCYGGVIPTLETLSKLEFIQKKIEHAFHIQLDMISGGNSSAISMMLSNKLPSFINNLRLGEVLVLGRETAYGQQVEGMYDDVFVLEAEIVELKEKPSMPEGLLGYDAFGHKVNFVDQGNMLRAILGIGRQDVYCEHLIPPVGVEILGCSSDHLIVQLKDKTYHLGDVIQFKMTYGGILSLMTSPYIRRVYEQSI